MLFRSFFSFLRKPYFFHSEFNILFISVGLTMSYTLESFGVWGFFKEKES